MRETTIRSAVRFAAISAVFAVSLQAASAVEPGGSSAQPSPTVYTAKADGAAGQMLAKAQSAGEIRVIVGLAMAMQSSQGMSADAAAAQSQALDAAQSRVALRARGSASGDGVVKFDTIPFVSLIVTADQLSKLIADPEVVSIQEDVPVAPTLNQSVPLINGDDVVAKGFTGAGRTVAVLDTGVQSNHPMLAGKVIAEACYSTTNASLSATSVCPGGVPASTATGSGLPCPADVEGCYHGTHVASIAAGNSTTLKGVAPGARVMAVQVFTKFTGSSNCGSASACARSFTTDQVKGLERVLALAPSLKIDAVNMSLGGGQFFAYCDSNNPAETAAINNLRAAGVATAIASGNNGFTGSIGSPSCIQSAIRVGSTTKTDAISSFSNHSPLVDLLAPGSSIYAALPPANYGVLSGTSMATPHVAGSFALLRSAKPDASVADILGALSCTGKQIFNREASTAITYSKPRIDLLAALTVLGKKQKSDDWSFKKSKDEKDWPALLGKWQTKDGFYQGKGKSWVATATLNCSPSLQIKTSLSRVNKDNAGFYANVGVLYKATIASDGSVSGYFAAYNDCPTNSDGVCTGSSVDKPGNATLFRISNLNLVTNTGFATVVCRAQAKVNVGKINDIDVTSTPSRQTYKLNGKTVCSVSDAASVAGGVAIVGYNASGKAKELKVDDIDIAISKADIARSEAEAEAETGVSAPASEGPRLPASAIQGDAVNVSASAQ